MAVGVAPVDLPLVDTLVTPRQHRTCRARFGSAPSSWHSCFLRCLTVRSGGSGRL